MIAYLRGKILHKAPNQVTIDTGGVGYLVSIPLSTYFHLGEVKDQAELLIYTHMTDSSLSLYGFSTWEERDIFLKLIGISGIGPRLAMNILSGIEPSELEEAIQKSDIARISMVPGIGKKTALRIAMELQDKLEKKEKILAAKGAKEKEDLISALMNMGFRRKEVERVVDETLRALPGETSIERLLRESLKKLAKI